MILVTFGDSDWASEEFVECSSMITRDLSAKCPLFALGNPFHRSGWRTLSLRSYSFPMERRFRLSFIPTLFRVGRGNCVTKVCLAFDDVPPSNVCRGLRFSFLSFQCSGNQFAASDRHFRDALMFL